MIRSSVLVDKAWLAWEEFWVVAEELAVFVKSEVVHVVLKFTREASTLLGFSFGSLKGPLPDLTAGDSWTGGAVFLRVPRGAYSIVIR